MKVSVINKKQGVYLGQKDVVALLKLEPEALKLDKSHKVKKNICFVVDKSSSMDASVKKEKYFNHFATNGVNPALNIRGMQNHQDQQKNLQDYLNQVQTPKEVNKTRFQLVIAATKKAVSQLTHEDFASVVLFGSESSVLCPAMQMTEQNKLWFIQQLNQATCDGMTNLHGGWTMGVQEVSKNLADGYINRVILLTDGAVNQGETNPDNIVTHVAEVNKFSVSTTTIGVGEGFNESLLQGMSSAGNGNSYFIDSDESVTKTFDMEFTGLSNLSATEIRVSVKTSSGVKLVKNMNLFSTEDNKFKFPSLSSQDINAVFVFSLEDNKTKGIPSISFKVTYKDVNGNKHELKSSLELSVHSKDAVLKMEENQDVKIQELLNVIAEQKIAAQDAYSKGNIVGATNAISGSVMAATASLQAFAGNAEYSSLLSAELDNLNVLSKSASVAGDESFSKTLSYQAYRTRNAQDKQ